MSDDPGQHFYASATPDDIRRKVAAYRAFKQAAARKARRTALLLLGLFLVSLLAGPWLTGHRRAAGHPAVRGSRHARR